MNARNLCIFNSDGVFGNDRRLSAWQQMQQCLREPAELNKKRNLQRAREADSQ